MELRRADRRPLAYTTLAPLELLKVTEPPEKQPLLLALEEEA